MKDGKGRERWKGRDTGDGKVRRKLWSERQKGEGEMEGQRYR